MSLNSSPNPVSSKNFAFYISIRDVFWVNFCIKREVQVKIQAVAEGLPGWLVVFQLSDSLCASQRDVFRHGRMNRVGGQSFIISPLKVAKNSASLFREGIVTASWRRTASPCSQLLTCRFSSQRRLGPFPLDVHCRYAILFLLTPVTWFCCGLESGYLI